MERVIARGLPAAGPSPTVRVGVLSRARGYARHRVWLCWSLAAAAGVADYISRENLWGAVLRHAGMTLLMSLPVLPVVWLVIQAEKARHMFRPTRSCRRQ
jgi:hypothetical protein